MTVIERQKALGFNFVRLQFSFVDLRSPARSAQYPCNGPNPTACGIAQSVLKAGQALPSSASHPVTIYVSIEFGYRWVASGRPEPWSSCAQLGCV